MRSKGSLKPLIPCLDDPVNKLEGLGEKTRRNLQDVRVCAASLEMADAVPEECRNTVTTGLSSSFPSPLHPPFLPPLAHSWLHIGGFDCFTTSWGHVPQHQVLSAPTADWISSAVE